MAAAMDEEDLLTQFGDQIHWQETVTWILSGRVSRLWANENWVPWFFKPGPCPGPTLKW